MFAVEFNLPSQESSGNLMDNYDDDDHASGRLSFCDFPLSVNICDWDPSKEVYKKSPCDEDLFEFITTKDLFADYAKDNIIFCGKLIPYKTPKSENSSSISTNQKNSKKLKCKSDVSVMANSRLKPSRWYTVAFGLRRFQMGKMELSDIKARQNRRNNSMKKVMAASDEMSVKSDEGKRGKGSLWGLLRLLGRKALNQNGNSSSTDKSSFARIKE